MIVNGVFLLKMISDCLRRFVWRVFNLVLVGV